MYVRTKYGKDDCFYVKDIHVCQQSLAMGKGEWGGGRRLKFLFEQEVLHYYCDLFLRWSFPVQMLPSFFFYFCSWLNSGSKSYI